MDLTGLYNVEDPQSAGSDEAMARHLMQVYGPEEGSRIFNEFLIKRAQEKNKALQSLKLKGMK